MKKLLLLLLLINFSANAQIPAHRENGFLFIENKGQVADQDGTIRPDVLYAAHSGGAGLYFTANSIFYQFTKGKQEQSAKAKHGHEIKQERHEFSTHRFTFQLVGSNPHPIVINESAATYTENFYLAHCPQGVLGVKSYRKITYKNVYPGIDWVLYSKGQFFEYDFIVNPGADPSAIRFTITGADKALLLPSGQLKIDTRLGSVTEHAPKSFSDRGKEIATEFMTLENGSFGFKGSFPENERFRIDPEVVWASVSPIGDGLTQIRSMIEDNNSNLYFTGETFCATGIAQNGYNNNYMGSADLYLRKLGSDGQILWSTYYGGADSDVNFYRSLSTDSAGNIYLSGTTGSTNLAYGGYQNQPNGYGDTLLVKFSATGVRLWATYYGGSASENHCVTLTDNNDNVYIVGQTTSSDLPSGASVYRGDQDCFIVKFNAQGNRLWSRYFGGPGYEWFRDAVLDSAGNLIICGLTLSTTYIDSAQPNVPADIGYAGFLAKFDSNGGVSWSKYLSDWPVTMACDSNNNIYYCNVLFSEDLLDIKKFDANGNQVYFEDTIFPQNFHSLAVANDHVYLYTESSSSNTNIPAVGPTYVAPGVPPVYPNTLYKLSLSGEHRWKWTTYTGNITFCTGAGGNIYLSTLSYSNEISRIGIIKMHDPNCNSPLPSVFSQSFCTGTTAAALSANGTNLKWYDSNNNLITPQTVLNQDNYYVSQTVNGCESEKKDMFVTIYPVTPLPVAQAQSFCGTKKISNIVISGSNIKWYGNAQMGYLLSAGTTLTTGTYYATQTLNGCESLPLAVEITVTTTPPPSVPPFYSCTPATFGDIPVTISNLQYYTTLVGGTPLPLTTPIDNNGVYYVTQTINGCESARTSCTVKVYNLQPPTGQSSQVLCQYKTLNDVLLYSQYNRRFYNTPTGGTPLPGTTVLFASGTYYVSQATGSPANCESSRIPVTITVQPLPAAPTAPAAQTVCEGANITDLVAEGTNLTWYRDNYQISIYEQLYTGVYQVRQNVNGCPGGFRNVQVTITTTAIPTVPGGTYSACPGATVAALPATGSNLKWYSSATATTALASTDLLATGTYYVSQTLNGCESQRIPKMVNVTNVALPQAPATQTFCAGATIANLSATGQNKKWYTATSGGTALAGGTLLQSGTYYVSQTPGSCESFRVPVAVTVNTVDPPTGQSIQIVETMPDEQPTIASLQASGQQVTWYASAANALSGTNPLPLTTIIISGSTYYAMQTNGNCRSASPLAVMVTIVLSRNDVSTTEFYYYPNPVAEKLTLWARRIIARVTVYNMLGQEVLQITPEATETSLDFSRLADGVYIIDAASENMVKRFRIIKQ